MNTREQLHAMIDQFEEGELLAAEAYLLSVLHSRSRPEFNQQTTARIKERTDRFQTSAEQHWQESVQRVKESGRGFVSGFGGGGGIGIDHQGRAEGTMSFHYRDGEGWVHETLRFFAGNEVEIIERFAMSDEGTELLYAQKVTCGGRVVERAETFPVDGR